ncbi:MAG TPA: efflux RND transporter periplasmic adaptor subunit [Edaphobacter sp.]
MPLGKAQLGLPAALSIVGLVIGCSSKPSTPPEEARPVKTMVVAAGDTPTVRSFPGRVEASRMVDLAFQVSGVLVKLPFREGQRASKGAMIAQLRQDEFQARLQTVQATLDQARAQLGAAESKLSNAKTESERFGRLVDSSAVSRSDFDLAQTTYRASQQDYNAQQAAIRGLEGRVAEAKLQFGDSTLRAPYDGVVAQRLVDEGQNIVANSAVIRFQNVNDIDIVADVPEGFIAGEIRSSNIQQSVAELSTAPGRQFPVHIKEVAQIADPKTQIFEIRFAMKAPPSVTALPGMTATVTVTTRGARTPGNILLVPVSAVSKQETGEQVVWLLGSDQTVHRRPVKMGAPTGDRIEIVSGVQAGDRIVVGGAPFLREGMKVRDLGDALGGSQ